MMLSWVIELEIGIGEMSKFNIEEVREMSFEDQIVELEKQIQRVKEAREQNTANIRHLEEVNENPVSYTHLTLPTIYSV